MLQRHIISRQYHPIIAQLIGKLHQEGITRTHIDIHKITTNSTLWPSIKIISIHIVILTVDHIRAMEKGVAYGVNGVRHKYSNDPNYKEKRLFLKFCKKGSQSGHSILTCPEKRYTKP